MCVLQSYADLLTENGEYEQAETVIREALGILPDEMTLYPASLVRAGHIFLHNGKLLEALGAATLSPELSEQHFGPESESAAKARALKESVLEAMG